MSPFVLDCSVAMAWCFDDEANAYADSALTALADTEAVVPGLWPLEVANVLALAERHTRISMAGTATFLRFLSRLPINVDGETSQRAFDGILNLARAQGLTAYDAAYLELAVRQAAPLATQDRRLRSVAKKVGVAVFVS